MDDTKFLQVYRSVAEKTFGGEPFCDLCGMERGDTFVFYEPMGQFVLMCELCAKFYSNTDDYGEW